MFAKSITPEEIEKLDFASFKGEIHVIDQPGKEFDNAGKTDRS